MQVRIQVADHLKRKIEIYLFIFLPAYYPSIASAKILNFKMLNILIYYTHLGMKPGIKPFHQ